MATTIHQQQTAIENIQLYGIHLHGQCPEKPGDHGYIYTVGMTKYGLPELICFGLPHNRMAGYFNYMFQEMYEGRISKDIKRDDDFWTFSTYLDDVETFVLRRHAELVFDVFKSPHIPKFKQVVWPDNKGYYPWEKQCSAEIKARQPYFGTRTKRDKDHNPDQDQSLSVG